MLNYDNYVTFARGEEPTLSLRSFWDPEDGFVWSKGKWCEITFEFDAGRASKLGLGELMLDMDVFKHPDALPGQNVLIYLNGLRIGSSLVTRRLNAIATFDTAILKKLDNVLTIDTPDAASPASFGSGDARQLGIQLFSLQIRRAG